ncbi:MAG TPA: putative porin, partial [Xanthomonadales bacterium]|nr:putative porin [Xanthomonadales bacterium]
ELNGRPARLFLNHVQTLDASAFDTGYAAGFKYGSASAPGGWEFAYAYQDLEADAAFALLADSDFGGGGTDARGHVLKGGYGIAKNWKASFTYFLNERQANAGNEHDYDRLQFDLGFRY